MAKNNNLEISQNEFSEIVKHPLTVVDFFAEWCMPCLMLAPVIEDLASAYGEKIKFAKMNIDDNSEIAKKFNVMSIPTLIVFKHGKEVERITGALPQEVLEEKLQKHL
jgi:thioredoxin 1